MAKFYVVWNGRTPGIYTTWSDCEAQVKGFKGAQYKSFTNKQEAEAAFKGEELSAEKNEVGYVEDSISTDAACSGNPGIMEFRGVHTTTKEQFYHYGPFPVGTNNVGEFLGIVTALRYAQEMGWNDKIIYSDSQTAIAWVRNKKAGTTLERNYHTEKLWMMIEQAEDWLLDNEYKNPIIKWQTHLWGEIAADFGRK